MRSEVWRIPIWPPEKHVVQERLEVVRPGRGWRFRETEGPE